MARQHVLQHFPDPYDCPACAVAGYEERERIDREKCKKCPMYDAWPTAYGLGSLKRCTSDGSAFGEWEYTDEDEIEKRIASAIIIRDAIRYNWKEKR